MDQVTGERNMTREDVCEELANVLADTFGIPVDELEWETPLSQQGLDSLDQVELVMHMEDQLDIYIGTGDEQYESADVTPNMFADRITKQFGE